MPANSCNDVVPCDSHAVVKVNTTEFVVEH